MVTFQEWGKKLDKLAERLSDRTQGGVQKAGGEIKSLSKKLDDLGDRIKKITHEGVQRVSGETKEMIQIVRLKAQVRDKKKDIDSLTKQLGAKTYQFHLDKKIGHVELKKLGGMITQLKKDIEAKRKQITKLRKKAK